MHLHEYELTLFGIPVYLDVLVSIFNNNPTYFFTEGIFRKSSSVSKEEQVVEYLSNK